jgi:hypothetical protein
MATRNRGGLMLLHGPYFQSLRRDTPHGNCTMVKVPTPVPALQLHLEREEFSLESS